MESVNIDKPKPVTIWDLFGLFYTIYLFFLSALCELLWIPATLVFFLVRGESVSEYKFKQWEKSLASMIILVMAILTVFSVTLGFHTLVQYRVWRGDFVGTFKGTEGYSAQAAYKQALAASIAYSNKFMNYNQEKMDEWNNMDKWDRENVDHPVFRMRNFPEASDELKKLAEENYTRVMEEEGYSFRGPMPDRLFWADNYRRRAQMACRDKFLYSDYYKTVTLKGIYKELPYEPRW